MALITEIWYYACLMPETVTFTPIIGDRNLLPDAYEEGLSFVSIEEFGPDVIPDIIREQEAICDVCPLDECDPGFSRARRKIMLVGNKTGTSGCLLFKLSE